MRPLEYQGILTGNTIAAVALLTTLDQGLYDCAQSLEGRLCGFGLVWGGSFLDCSSFDIEFLKISCLGLTPFLPFFLTFAGS